MSMMAERMKLILNERIHPDQNGFLPMRQIRNNTRTIINILEYYETHPGSQVFLDAQKVFDNLNWEVIKCQINLMKFGDNFTQMLESIYLNQKARVMINGEFTNPFKIKKVSGRDVYCRLCFLLQY
uniref:Uncharacterized protein n=1 Tax=Micrurus lemniscatus lemniscatus TaxID=129467 RepID=A0A2D4HTF6_MICLE